MERLTKRDTDGQAMMDCLKCEADWTGKHGKPMVDCTALYCRNRLKARLAAYEDTGLTPEEVNDAVAGGETGLGVWRRGGEAARAGGSRQGRARGGAARRRRKR